MKIRVDKFTGIAPRYGPKVLPENAAQVAENARLESGELRAFTAPSPVTATLVTAALSVYPLGGPAFKYLSWATDVDVVGSPIADDENRVYYTGDGVPKKTRLGMLGIGAGPHPASNWLHLGVPAPSAAPTLASAGAGSITEKWVYVWTYIATFGAVTEESAPSPPASIQLTSNSGAVISGMADPAVTANYNFTGKRLYRSVGAGALTLVTELPLGTTSYTDTSVTTLGDVLQTDGWLPPPADLKGLQLLTNGGMAGFRNNEIWFSEPGYPHAWPAKYMQTVNAKVVAIKAFGNSIAVGTEAYPEIGTGVHPESFTFQLIALRAPCVSKRSMAGDESGVTYACPDGLMSIGYDGNGLATQKLLTRFEFRNFAPASMSSVVFAQRYFGFFTEAGVTHALVFQRGDTPPLVTLSVAAAGVAVEPLTNRLLAINATTNSLVHVDPLDTLPMTYYWKSKLFELPFPTNMACARAVMADITPDDSAYIAWVGAQNAAAEAQNAITFASGNLGGALNTSLLNTRQVGGSLLISEIPMPDRQVTIYIFASGVLVFSGRVDPNEIVMLPDGFTARNWEIALSGQRSVQAAEMATSVEDLVQ